MSRLQDVQVSEWTRRWWETLPSAYREADAVQSAGAVRPAAGLTEDPLYIEGDGDDWTRTILSETVESTVSQMQRTFFNVAVMTPLYLHAWWDLPAADQCSISFRVAGVTGTILASWDSGELDPGPGGHVIPIAAPVPSPFIVTVRITRTNNVPADKYELKGLFIADQEVDYDNIPDGPEEAPTYPLLRFMDGIGSIAGRIRMLSDQMWSGELMNPETVPDNTVHWLAQMVGLPAGIRNQAPAEVRELLVQLQKSGRPPVGTRAALADVVRQYLQKDRVAMVIPDPRTPHTLLILVAADDVPTRGLDWVKQKVRDSGAVPAGHTLTIMPAESTWDAWMKEAGPTWADLEAKVGTWNESDSLGVFAEGEEGIPEID